MQVPAMLSPGELVSQVTVSLLIDGAQVLYKSSACSCLLSHLPSPIFFCLITVFAEVPLKPRHFGLERWLGG